MKRNSIKIISEGFFLLNENQNFRFDRQKAKLIIEKIQFPIIVLDTEFLNHSHDFTNYKKKLYDNSNRDLVYVIQYSIAKTFKEIANRNNQKAIKSLRVIRQFNDKEYDFQKQYKKMILEFLNICLTKNIKTIVCAGAVNDIKIINQWLNEYKRFFTKKPLKMAYFDKKNETLTANYFDIYVILEKLFSFSNTTKDGLEFYKKENLPKGKQHDEMIALTSSKKFFDWFEDICKDLQIDEKEDIKQLCRNAYSFYAKPNNEKLTLKEFMHFNKNIKKVLDHCYNDVLRILEFLAFVYEFSYLPYAKNSFINKEV